MTSGATLKAVERFGVYTALGIRFWDTALNEQVREGLRVTAWPNSELSSTESSAQEPRAWSVLGNWRKVNAYRTKSDIYAFQGLPGLSRSELTSEQADFNIGSSLEQKSYVVSVEDGLGRFLPVACSVDLPLPYRGVFPGNGMFSPMGPIPRGFLLFSAVSRPKPSWLAAVYGELFDTVEGRAAAHALIKVRIEGMEVYGLSDAEGRFAVFLQYPAIGEAGGNYSPPILGLGSIFSESWPVELNVYYQPHNQKKDLPRTDLPDYRSILTQRQADIWMQSPDTGTPEDSWSGQLKFGEELIVNTADERQLLISHRI